MNYIKTIFLKANQDKTIEPSSNVTVIYGYSATGKTLLFKLIEFALGKNEVIDIDEAKKQFEGLVYVQIEFTKGQIIRRALDKEFHGYVKENGSDELEEKLIGAYRKYIGEIFRHKDIDVIRNISSLATTKLTVPEFISNFFFSESKIGNADPFYKLEGRTEEVKLKNYFKYFVTGMIIDDKEIKLQKKEIKRVKEEKSISSFFKNFKKLVKIPSQKQGNLYNNLPNEIASSQNKIISLKDEMLKIAQKISEDKILMDRFASLKELYVSQIEDLKGSIAIDSFMDSAWIKCDKCGNKIIWEHENSSEEAIVQLRFSIEEISIVEFNKQKEISSDNMMRTNIIKLIEKENEKLNKLKKEKEEVECVFHDYSSYINAHNIFLKKEQEEKNDNPKLNINEEIEKKFINQINSLCINISNRLKVWKMPKHTEVSFDYEKFEFTYDNTPRNILAKGYKSFCTTAMIIELVNQMKSVEVSCFDFILIDTIWQVADFKEIDIQEVAKNYINDVANLNIQTIIFENKVPNSTNANCKIIQLS